MFQRRAGRAERERRKGEKERGGGGSVPGFLPPVAPSLPRPPLFLLSSSPPLLLSSSPPLIRKQKKTESPAVIETATTRSQTNSFTAVARSTTELQRPLSMFSGKCCL